MTLYSLTASVHRAYEARQGRLDRGQTSIHDTVYSGEQQGAIAMANTCVDTRLSSNTLPNTLTMVGVVLSVLFSMSMSAQAADLTDVVDAAEEDDPFDFHLEPRFKSTIKRAKITREAPCNPNVTEDPLTGDQAVDRNSRLRYPRLVEEGRCSEPDTVYNKELRGWRRIDQLDILGNIGLYKDVELHFTLPFIFRDVRGVHFAGNGGDPTEPIVDTDNSSVDPSNQRIIEDIQRNGEDFTTFRLFDVRDGNEGPTRSGFGDMSLGLAWNPFNQERDDTKATLLLGFDYLIPTGTVAKGGNEGVGRGVHELQLTVAASKRFRYLDPY